MAEPRSPPRSAERPVAVLSAIAANLVVAAAKFAGAAATGSAALTSEGIHSLVDTGNGLLILLGRRRANRAASPSHPFGHGKELYFYTLVVAILIFAGGGGMSVWEGVAHIRHPPERGSPTWGYAILAVAFVSESLSFRVAARRLCKDTGTANVWAAIRSSNDPSTFTVVFEDSAAIAGVAIAALGLFLADHLDKSYLDGLASVLIGVLLAAVAWLLARESKELLIGRAADPAMLARIRALAERHEQVEKVLDVASMYFGPHEVLLNIDLKFRGSLRADEMVRVVDDLEHAIRETFPDVSRISIEARSFRAPPGAGASLEAPTRPSEP